MNYYDEIKNRIIDDETYSKVKDYSKEKHRVETYYEIGKLLSEAGKHYGENIIGEYSKKLTIECGKKYNKRTLFRMKQFYLMFNNKKVSPLVTQLTWTHYVLLLPLQNENKINYYINLCIKQNLSKRQLIEKINSKEYERLSEETKIKLINKEETNIQELVPNPIIIKNNNNIEVINEKMLHRVILEDISSFMKELGNGYSFIDSEYKIKVNDRYNFIDLLLYNIEYMCYVVVELKTTELKKEHIGQIEFYMNYIDNNLKKANQEKTIGIIIAKKDNKYVMAYCSNKNIVSTTYVLSNTNIIVD